jgi:hypothetical protein
MPEHRQRVRLNKNLLVSYQKLNDYMRSPSKSKDISEEGVCLPVFHRLEVGTTLKMWIDLKDNKGPIVAIGEVAWINRRNDAECPYEAGIKFIEVNSANRDRIAKYISNLKDATSV